MLFSEYKPEYDKKRQKKLDKEVKEREKNLEKLKKDLASGEGSEVKLSGMSDMNSVKLQHGCCLSYLMLVFERHYHGHSD